MTVGYREDAQPVDSRRSDAFDLIVELRLHRPHLPSVQSLETQVAGRRPSI